MNDKRFVLWLHEQLPQWLARGWISEENADAMRVHYGELPPQRGPSLIRLITVAIGLCLVGMGIFLIFAGYWYTFSPNGRFDWSLALLLLGFVVVALALWAAPRSSPFAEGAAIFFMLALGGATFLISDTYYIGDQSGLALLLVLALSLPIIYVLGAGIAMVGYLLGTLFWSVTSQVAEAWLSALVVWGLLLLGIPFYLEKLKARATNFYLLMWLSWAYVASVFGAFFFTVEGLQNSFKVLFLAVLSALTYGVGALIPRKALWTLPFRVIGGIGLCYVILLGSFLKTWDTTALITAAWWQLVLAIPALLFSWYIFRVFVQRRQVVPSFIMIAPTIVAICMALSYYRLSALAVSVVFTVYILLVAILLFFRGSVEKNVGLVNGSIITIFVHIIARFLDPSFTFVERGTVFIGCGILVIMVNLLYMYRKSQQVKEIHREVRGARRRNGQSTELADQEMEILDSISDSLKVKQSEHEGADVLKVDSGDRISDSEGFAPLRPSKNKGGADREV